MESRKVLLAFYSSELTAHARLIIGFSLILLTIIEVFSNTYRSGFGVRFIAYSAMFFVSSGLWYLLMRDMVYGILAHCSTFAPVLPNSTLPTMLQKIQEGVTEVALTQDKILGYVPSGWFYSATHEKSEPGWGRVLSFALGGFSTFCAIWLVDHSLIWDVLALLSMLAVSMFYGLYLIIRGRR